MDKIVFETNWNNKLYCKYFTTLRLYNPAFYFTGKNFEIYYKKEFLGIARIDDIRVTNLEKLNPFVCGLDTGYSVEETKNIFRKMYKNNADINIETHLLNLVLLRYYGQKEVKPEWKKVIEGGGEKNES